MCESLAHVRAQPASPAVAIDGQGKNHRARLTVKSALTADAVTGSHKPRERCFEFSSAPSLNGIALRS
jgi:hypothetical protein